MESLEVKSSDLEQRLNYNRYMPENETHQLIMISYLLSHRFYEEEWEEGQSEIEVEGL